MRSGPPPRPALVVNRLFMQEFLAAEPPCLALGLVEERQQLCGLLALRLDEALPPAIADRGFEFGHALWEYDLAVLHLVSAFPGFQTYNVLINPTIWSSKRSCARCSTTGITSFALQPQGQVTAFRADIGSEGLAVLRANRARLRVDHDGRAISAGPHVVCGPS